jgi:hypothetical protein
VYRLQLQLQVQINHLQLLQSFSYSCIAILIGRSSSETGCKNGKRTTTCDQCGIPIPSLSPPPVPQRVKKGKHTSRPSAGNISFHSHGTLYMAALRTLVAHSSLNHLCTQAFIVSHNVYTLFAPATAATAPIDTINSSIPNQSRLSILDCK